MTHNTFGSRVRDQVAANLREICVRVYGANFSYMSRDLGVDRKVFYNWEQKINCPTIMILERIVRGLNKRGLELSLDDLCYSEIILKPNPTNRD